MKKVYLVYASIFYDDGSHIVILLNIFASVIKAEVYANYKRLSIEHKGVSYVFGPGVDTAVIRVVFESICTVDWSDDLKNLQDEALSVRSEAIRIADEKRNIELTKKYNLLEFV